MQHVRTLLITLTAEFQQGLLTSMSAWIQHRKVFSSPFPKRKHVGRNWQEKWGELSSLATSSSWFHLWKAQFGMVNRSFILNLLLFCKKEMLVMQTWLYLGFRSSLGFECSPGALKASDFRLFKFGGFFAVTYSVAVCSWPASHPWCTENSLGELQKNSGIKNKVILVCWETDCIRELFKAVEHLKFIIRLV